MLPELTSERASAFVARFVVTFFLTGSIKFGAVLYESISSREGFTNASTGLLFILPYAVARLLGPGVNVLMRYFGPRTLSTVGGFFFAAGYICSGLCELIPQYMFAFFILSGLGLACMLLPTVLCLKQAFGEGLRLAIPLAMLGSYVGITIIPLVAVYAHQEYGTSATLMLFGAFSLNLIPCGLILSNGRTYDEIETEASEIPSGSKMELLENSSSEDGINSSNCPSGQSENAEGRDGNRLSRAFQFLKRFTNINFCLFFIVANIRKIPNDAWTLYLIPRTEATWVDSTTAASVGSMGGIGGVLGRLMAAASFKTKSLTPVILCSLYFFLNGLVFIGMEAFVYPTGLDWPMYIASFLNGLFLSAQSGMVAGILHLLVSENNFLTAYAVIDLGNGAISLLAGIGPGYLFDVYGDYGIAFTAIGIISLICGCLSLIIWLLGLWKLH